MYASTAAKSSVIPKTARSTESSANAMDILVGQSTPNKFGYGGGAVGVGTVAFHLEIRNHASQTVPLPRFALGPLPSSRNAVSFFGAHACVGLSRDQTHRQLVYRPFQFQKRSQYFIGAHNETLSIVMSINDPDCAPFQIES
jgi:hypothetical protein